MVFKHWLWIARLQWLVKFHKNPFEKFFYFIYLTRNGTTPVSKTFWILSEPPLERFEIAVKASIRASRSSRPIITFAKTGIVSCSILKGGAGFPLQRLAKAQVPCLIMVISPSEIAVSTRFTKGLTASPRKTRSLKIKLSPAIFPKVQTACAETSLWGDPRSLMSSGRAPLSTTSWVCVEVPEAKFDKDHAASS